MKRRFNDFNKLNKKDDNNLIGLKELENSIIDLYYYDYINQIVKKHNIDLPLHISIFLDNCSLVKSILLLKGNNKL